MNKRYLSMIAAAAAIILAASCASEQQEVLQQANQVEIRLRAEVSNMLLTRAATDIQGSQFDYVPANGDDPAKVEKINVEIVDAQVAQDGTDNPLSTTPVRVPYLFQTTATTSSDRSMEVASGTTPPYFPNSGNKVNIYAYYPSTVGTTSASTTVLDNTGSVTFSVQADQTTDANYKLSDLMYGVPTGGNPVARPESGAATVELTFAHKMSKIIVNATALAGVSQIQAVRIVGGSRTVNITDEACTIGTTLTDANTPAGTYISMYTGGTTTSSSCAALLPPQTVNGSFIEIETDLGTATYSVASKAFASGISYTYNISITAAQIGFTTDITDWDNANTISLVNDGSTELRYPLLSEAVTADVGKVICSNGHIHHTVSEIDCGGTASAMIAYVGDQNNAYGNGAYSETYNHGLAIALTDASGSPLTWSSASSSCSGYSRTRPSASGSWLFPTVYQYERMLIGCGSTAEYVEYSSQAFPSDTDSFASDLRTNLTSCGGTDLHDGGYWMNTGSTSGRAWRYMTGSTYSYFDGQGQTQNTAWARACFAF